MLTNFKVGDVEVTPGIRYEHTGVHDTYWISGNNGVDLNGQHYGWASSTSSFNEVLPSVFAAWRPDAAWDPDAGRDPEKCWMIDAS